MSIFSSIPIWGWGDIVSTGLVLIGVLSEWPFAMRKIAPDKENDLMPIGWRREKLKKRLGIILIFGVLGELGCLPPSLIESAELNNEAANAWMAAADSESNNLVLRKELLPRSDLFSARKFLQSLQGKRKASVVIIFESSESFDLAIQIRRFLVSDGWNVPPCRPVSEEDALGESDNPLLQQGSLIVRAGAPAGTIAFATKHHWGAWEDDFDNRDDPKIYFRDALKAAGVPFTPVYRLNMKLPEGVVSIIIGDKSWPD